MSVVLPFSQLWIVLLLIAVLYNHLKSRKSACLTAITVAAIHAVTNIVVHSTNTELDVFLVAHHGFIYVALPLMIAISIYWFNRHRFNIMMWITLLLLAVESIIAGLSIVAVDSVLLHYKHMLTIFSHCTLLYVLFRPYTPQRQSLSYHEITQLLEEVEAHVARLPDGIIKKDSTQHLEAAASLLFDFDAYGINQQYARCALTLINYAMKQSKFIKENRPC